MQASRFTFWTLILVVCIAGMSQGLTLPLLSVLLEREGISSVANGFNAAGLYIGILLVSPLLERISRRLGYRTTIIAGLLLVTLCTVLFPVLTNFVFWFILRLLLGIGDVSLHYASQVWVATLAAPERRGRDLSMYGFAYGAGFSIGPLGMLLLPYGTWVPFAAICLFYLAAFWMLFRIPNEFPEKVAAAPTRENRYTKVVRLSWLTLLPAFLYGYMELTLNVSFPVYALRSGISPEWVSVILPAFALGSLVLQMPLGRWSDMVGRKKVMMICSSIGAIAFFLFPLAGNHVWALMALSGIVGAMVGSFYSLGLAFAADILPKSMVPTAGIIASMNFSVASILAPNLNGMLMDYAWSGSMFILLAIFFCMFTAAGFFFKHTSQPFDEIPIAEKNSTPI